MYAKITAAFGVLLSLAVNIGGIEYMGILKNPYVTGLLLFGAAFSITDNMRMAAVVLAIHYALIAVHTELRTAESTAAGPGAEAAPSLSPAAYPAAGPAARRDGSPAVRARVATALRRPVSDRN